MKFELKSTIQITQTLTNKSILVDYVGGVTCNHIKVVLGMKINEVWVMKRNEKRWKKIKSEIVWLRWKRV